MAALAWILGIIGAIAAIALVVVFLNRFYRKSSRDIALVRTGFGGQRIVISGGCLALLIRRAREPARARIGACVELRHRRLAQLNEDFDWFLHRVDVAFLEALGRERR